ANTIAEMVRFNLPDDYWNTYSERVRALDLDHVSRTSRTLVHPDKLVWVVVGDREKIEAGIKELALGDVKLMDPDGNILEKGERMAAD
ncbi:MAG: hypothetical protein ACE5HU_09885, partial [Acidobacteriota bacterium]